ncbi:uncharacterized protein LOC123551160 [Mercenaria mercenaria]|uniref:uncharacterized protein LOC123551160 n=1 Tax=Mercenaria mercenaria TaxID=6596 RepID=UPI00234ECAB8|nr:uncharacterized protein LOC123551160 [Mercenaria mercenaria]
MAFIGETIYEDYLYRFTGKSRSILWGKGNPWRQKYFIIKRVGNKPVLEFFNKKPKTRNTVPKGKIELWPSFRVEKVTNMKNRAYVFQITTPDTTICLSTDEQRTMDIFVFFLQIQTRLKDQIRDDYFTVHPENSEAQRRIGAKGTNCVLHISPYGITLALQSNRAVLAQWPLKSIRSYESSEQGHLSIEAGRVAPMGDGLYIYRTEPGDDNQIYDLIDRYVLDALEQVQPALRGGSEEIEDYVIEAERLLSLTVVSACTAENPDIHTILRENWSTDVQTPQGSSRPRQIVHTRLTSAESLGSLNSQNSFTGPQSVPARLIHETGSARNSPQVPRSLPAFQNSPSLGSRRGSNQSQPNLADRPPAPPPPPASSSIPLKIPQRSATQSSGHYLRMNSAASRTSGSSGSPFTPTSADWVPPPTFRDAMRQKSTSPISENGPYNPDSYLTPTSPGAITTSTPNDKFAGARPMLKDQYLTPLSVSEEQTAVKSSSTVRHTEGKGSAKVVKKELKLSPKHVGQSEHENKAISTSRVRSRRLRSASCEDLSDYLRSVVYDPISKSMNDLLDDSDRDKEDDYLGPEPFPRLQSFSGVIDHDHGHTPENYYNIEGLKGKIYDGPGLPFAELRKKFSKRSLSRIRRSVSNPNFIGSLSLEKLNLARVSIGITTSSPNESRSSSLANLIPEALKKHLSKDSSHKGSSSALSSGAASRNSSLTSSRASSAHVSPYNSLGRKNKHTPKEDIVGSTSVKGINLTKRSRSFRRHRPVEEEHSKHGHRHENHSEHKADMPNGEADGHIQNVSNGSEMKPSDLNSKGRQETAPSENAVQLTLSDIGADSKPTKPTPKIAPKPKPKPTVHGDKTENEESATSAL